MQKYGVEVRRNDHGQAPSGVGAGRSWYGGRASGAAKKECLFLTNKANMLLKTKDWKNEQSQTKPIESNKLLKTKDKQREMVTNKAIMLLKTKDWGN